jgi:hypothetical protein
MLPAWVYNISSEPFRLLLLCLALSSCKPGLEEPAYTSGEADFGIMVSLGGSFTAGVTDSALTLEGQQNSYPALMAASFSKAGGGAFKQPLVNAGNGIGYDLFTQTFRGKVDLQSYTSCKGGNDLRLTVNAFNPSDFSWIGNQALFSNLGIPGARASNLNSQFFGLPGTGNPYYYRIATDTGGLTGLSSTVLGNAQSLTPTFFTIWVGIDDLLPYAVSGGSAELGPRYEITPESIFSQALDTLVFGLASNNTDGLMATVPDITLFPYFNTIPYNGLVLTKAEADSLNLISPPGISFSEGANPLVVRNSGTGTIRQLNEDEKVLLSASRDSVRCGLLGTTSRPLSDRQVLKSNEIAAIRTATSLYNNKIRSIAQLYDLALADMHGFFAKLGLGIKSEGLDFTSEYLYGGFFSSDGIHPNARGYALIADEMIRAVNGRYRSNVPLVSASRGRGISFP